MKFNPKLIDFFKRHNLYGEEMFKYLESHTTMIDYNNEEERCFIGCFYVLDKYNILKSLILNLPYVDNEKTMLISIHELTHGIENYQKLGKKFKKDITIEALPLLYEKLYILENPSNNLIAYGEYLDSQITKNEREYQFGLDVRNQLIDKYEYNPKKTAKMVKKISRKYK